jgi:hypothetical protein
VKTLLPYVIAAVIIALPGWYPALALSRGVDAATVREAARIYAYERLGHHLVFHRFAHAFLLRHAALVIVLGLLWRYGNPTPGLWRLYGVCAGAVAIALVGVVVDQSLLYHPDIAAGLLRYYFFRLTDALVPVGVALGVVAMVLRWESTHPKRYVAGIIALLLVSGSHLGNVALQRQRERLPPAVVQSLPRSRAPAWRLWEESVDEDALPPEMPPPVEAPTMELSQPPQQRIAFNTAEQRSDWHQQWLATCQWIRAHTQPTDRFLTCRSQQTFKWYAQRPEVANWKDVPQDARSLVAWHAAWNELHPPENGGQDLAGHTDERLRELVAKYDVQYLVIDRSRSSRVLGLQRVYPLAVSEATLFAVYRVEQESNAAPVTVRRETGYPIGK